LTEFNVGVVGEKTSGWDQRNIITLYMYFTFPCACQGSCCTKRILRKSLLPINL